MHLGFPWNGRVVFSRSGEVFKVRKRILELHLSQIELRNLTILLLAFKMQLKTIKMVPIFKSMLKHIKISGGSGELHFP